MLVWLGYINFLLAVFNMVPGFPLDGGRVLRGIIWWITGARSRATRIAAQVGEFVSYAFIVIGLVRFFGGAGVGGLWISFIGWFLLDASRASQAQVGVTEALRGLQVGDVMSRDYVTIDGRSNIQSFADEHLLRSGRRCFIVTENGRVVGLITPQEVRQIPHAQWPYKTLDVVVSLKAVAAKFHNTLAEMILSVAMRTGEELVVMSGCCFQNKYLVERSCWPSEPGRLSRLHASPDTA